MWLGFSNYSTFTSPKFVSSFESYKFHPSGSCSDLVSPVLCYKRSFALPIELFYFHGLIRNAQKLVTAGETGFMVHTYDPFWSYLGFCFSRECCWCLLLRIKHHSWLQFQLWCLRCWGRSLRLWKVSVKDIYWFHYSFQNSKLIVLTGWSWFDYILKVFRRLSHFTVENLRIFWN